MLRMTVLALGAAMSVVAVAGCGWTEEAYHEIRVRNDYAHTITELTIGPKTFYDIDPEETTEYLDIPEGTHEFRGKLKNSTATFEGSWSFTGRGHHQWTAVLGASGTFSFYED